MSFVTTIPLQKATSKAIPLIGLGTWKAKKGEVGAAVKEAILHASYRHIDCASNYLNEDEIGDTLKALFEDASNPIKREDIFITGKLNNPYHHREHVKEHLLKTLKDLQVEYLDLWLMHWPVAFVHVPFDATKRGFDSDYDPDGCSKIDLSSNGGSKIDRSVSVRETWQAMEEMVDQGLVRAIGVSNFSGSILHDLLTYARIKPVVNQIELHPYLQQKELVAFCQRENIVVEGYSPLGTSGFKKPDEPSVLQDPVIGEIAARHGRSPAQICLRWATQRGVVALPKSVTPSRIRENISIFDFSLSEDDMKLMASLDRNYRFLRPNDWYGLPIFS